MTDDMRENVLQGADHPRPLPSELRTRLERALLAGDPELTALALADRSRPLPEGLRHQLESALASSPAVALPGGLRRRLQRRLVPRPVWQPAAAVAAALLLVVGLVAVALQGGGGDDGVDVAARQRQQERRSDEAAGGSAIGADAASPAATGGAAAPADAGGAGTAAKTAPPSPAAARTAAGTASASPSSPPPPYAQPSRPGTAAATAGPAPDTANASRPPLRIGVVGGDPVQERGFRAYVDVLNRAGGAGGHPFTVVAPGPGTVATVNLASTALAAPAAVQQPVIESLAVTEAALQGTVFSIASVVERQAHLAVDAVFPGPSPGARAAIYHPAQGEFATRVPAALEEVLRARGVASLRVAYEPGQPPTFVAADAAFLSLSTDAARSWLQAAAQAGYGPSAGVHGVWSVADESLLSGLPASTRVLSPYTFTETEEVAALRRETGLPLSARSIHGWVTAKWLAVAVWRTDADTGAELAAALEATAGFDLGFVPPYEVRPGTRSRTPEAIVLAPAGDRFGVRGTFRRDPF